MLTKAFIEERKWARDSQFFIKTLAPQNSEQTLRFVLEKLGRLPSGFDPNPFLNLLKHEYPWVELRDESGYKQFEQVLAALSIPCQPFEGDVQEALDQIFPVILSDDVQSSSTPDIILREQSGDDSQLLVDLD